MARLLRAMRKANDGRPSLGEYSVILVLIAIFAIAALLVLGDPTTEVYRGVGKSV